MRLEKYLRERAEKDAEVLITEEDRLFCEQLAKKIVAEAERERQEKAKKKKENVKRSSD